MDLLYFNEQTGAVRRNETKFCNYWFRTFWRQHMPNFVEAGQEVLAIDSSVKTVSMNI